MKTLSPAARQGLRDGLTAAIPMSVSSFPFGLAYGVGVLAAGLDPWVGASASWTVLAGAAQLTMLSLIETSAPWVVVVVAGLVVNVRFALYSIALAPAFKEFPPRWRFALPYFMTDQAAALSLHYFTTTTDPVARRWYYLSVGSGIAVVWWIGTIVGITLGRAIPPSIDIAFTVPLVFVVLTVPTLIDRPGIIAAAVGAAVTVVTASLPYGLNTVIGAAAGVLIAAIADRRMRS
ncbi:MAG: AzlC family ABC transporter permease [Acidobacteria bacterium]|nr:AzlC family ABC transporter permease [Acidobacteriota bacterium]